MTHAVQMERVGSSWVAASRDGDFDDFVGRQGKVASRGKEILGKLRTAQDLQESGRRGREERLRDCERHTKGVGAAHIPRCSACSARLLSPVRYSD